MKQRQIQLNRRLIKYNFLKPQVDKLSSIQSRKSVINLRESKFYTML